MLNDLSQRTAALILFLSMVFPTSFALFKTVALLVPICCLLIGGGEVGKINNRLLLVAFFYSLVGIAWSFYGAILGNPGALRVLTVMVAYPVLFTLLVMLYQGQSIKLDSLFLTAAIAIVIVDLGFIAAEILIPGNPLGSLLRALYAGGAVVDYAGNYLKFTIPNVSTVIFLLSFVLCRAACMRVGLKMLVALFGLTLVVLLSGRRVILFTAVVGPLIAYILTVGAVSRRGLGAVKVIMFSGAIFATMAFFYSLWPSYFYERISSAFNFATDSSNIERVYQFNALLDGIYKNPLLGAGAGAVADYIRSEEMPWAYELFYVSMLFQYGFLGFAVYAIGVLFLVVFLTQEVRRKGRDTFEFYYLSGLISFLLASATNPYLAKFDYMWVLFVPVALLNYRFVERSQKGAAYVR
ncbi:hypothetical protein D3C77_287730 [compost metagenome]